MKNTTNHQNMNSTLSHQLQSKHIAKLFVLAIMLLANLSVFSQAGKDGSLTVSTSNTVLNRYTRVTADIPIGSNSLTVVNINELNRDGISYLPSGYTTNASSFASDALAEGDLILLFQAQGAIINTTNSLNYGEVTNLNNSGRYEMAYVGSVSGNTITLDCKTRFAYFAANYVQVIRIPQYTTLTVNSGASVVPIKWGDPAFGGADPSAVTRRRGGFLGILADDIVNEGSINANEAGFRGGTILNGSATSGDVFYSSYFYSSTFRGGEKGESIAGYRPDYDAMGGRYGMGAPANAGGGGGGHNCGGGGGANGGDPADWFRGAGVMNHFGTCGTPGAWSLDPNYIANSNALTNSAGGGHGGYSYSGLNANACSSGPSYPANFISSGVPLTDVLNTAWGGDRRKAFGGLGGRPLISPAIDRQIFFGGGGGAGDGNDNSNNDGGDGGGIVFLIVENDITGSGVIQANGESAPATKLDLSIGIKGNDAPGGGGGGGTVLVQANTVASGIKINANGGNGGNQNINLTNEGEGPGGGGGGGAIYMNSPSDASTKTVNGGSNGTTNSTALTEFIANGATSGNVGSLRTTAVYINFNKCLTDLQILKSVDESTPNYGTNVTFTLTANNLGQNNATNVVVTDLLPAGYTFVSANPSVGTYDDITGEWTIGSLSYPGSETLEIVATVNLTGSYTNTATITADEPDPEPSNNTASVSTVPSDCNAGPASSTPTVCIDASMTPITHSTTAATGIGTPTGLPTGVSASWSSDVITISGTPTVSGTFNYSIPLETGCGTEAATGTIVVQINTATSPATSSICVNSSLTPITITTTLATGIGSPTGLPAGVSASWLANVITISGTPTASGTFNYSIPLTGGCGTVNATGTINVTTTTNTVSAASSSPTLCINIALTPITHTTTQATGIGSPTGLPAGVSAVWSSNTITIYGAPTVAGVFNYSIPLTGGCGSVNATGTITVNGNATGGSTVNVTTCVSQAMVAVTRATTYINSMGTPTGLPSGVSASWSANVLTISGTPTSSGTFNYSIPLTGICSNTTATGTINVVSANTVGLPSSTPTLCINSAMTTVTITTGAATGISNAGVSGANGLPTGVSASWTNNVISITGTPTQSGTFNYSIPLTGGCGSVNATGTINVTPLNTASAGTTTSVCVNTALSPVITHTTTGAVTSLTYSLPAGISASYSANTITISGTPSSTGTYNYSIRLNGGCGTVYATGTIIRVANNTVSSASNPTVCINTAMTTINRTTTGATGISNAGVSGANGLPAGVSATWASNTLTISGTPTVAGTFNYSIALTGGCGTVNATGTITVTAANTVSAASSSPTLCISTAMTAITHSTTGATGRGTATGLPTGVTATWSANVLTISGTPTQSGTFNYSVPLTGGCVTTPATGTIIVTANNTAGTAPANPNICVNTALTPLTRTTTGATGIGSATGLPAGVSASWSSNTLTVSGTPTGTGTFNYTIPLTGGCGTINATGTITVVSQNTVSGTSGQTVCVNSAVSITRPTTGATGIGSATGLPSGVSASWSSNSISITGTPTVAGTYNYTVPLSGGCGTAVNATGTITVNPINTASAPSSTPTLCVNTALTSITHTTTGATGISNSGVSGANGLPTGVSATWASNTITISGTPSAAGTFNYSIPLTGGCGSVNATGTITVTPASVAGSISGGSTVCKETTGSLLTLSGNTGSIQWQTSSNNVTFSDISGETSSTYTVSSLSSTTYYRVVVTNGSCTSANSTSFTVTVQNPSVSASLSSGDYVWKGSGVNSTDSVDWLVPSNWYVYDGSEFAIASSLPTVEINVFIPSVGTCFQANPHIFTSSAPICKNLTILSSGHLTMHTGKLSVGGNWVNNGIFSCGTGEVIFIETGYHTIGGTVSVNAFYDFKMNKPADGGTKSVAYLLKQATISGTMTLTSGLFDINVFSIDMDDRPVVGGSNASYVRTSSTGFLKRYVGSAYDNMQSGYVRFPVGRSNFNQARLNNAGTSDKFSVRLFDNVSDDSEEESPTTTLPVVERTWIIEEQTVGGSDVDMQLYWNGTVESRDEELNAFDYNTAYIAHYNKNSPTWENKGGSAPSGPGYAQQNGITSFSPFTISSEGGLGWTGPLPVVLLNFDATCNEENNIDVTWSTASENNSSYFEVLKSTDGYTWENLDIVPAAGNSNSTLNYSILDNRVYEGNMYYKLTQFDVDGKYKTFDIIGVNCTASDLNNSIITYPNPSTDNIDLEFKSTDIEGTGIVTVTDSKGLIILMKNISIEKGTNVYMIDELKASPGLYYLKLTCNKYTSKVVKHIVK